MDELTQLKSEVAQLKKQVEDLYSNTGFPDVILDNLSRKGFVRINQILTTPFTTIDGYESKYFYMFANIGTDKFVFSNISATDFVLPTVSPSTDVFTANNHGFTDSNPVTVWSTTTPPDPLANGNTYYIRDATTNTFKLTDTIGGSAVNITDIGTGKLFLQKINIIP
jgi:hypothetical protein